MNSPASTTPVRPWYRKEDYIAIIIAFGLIAIIGFWSYVLRPDNMEELTANHTMTKEQIKRLDKSSESYAESKEKLNKQLTEIESKIAVMPLKTWLVKPSDWSNDPRDAFVRKSKSKDAPPKSTGIIGSLVVTGIVLLIVFSIGVFVMGDSTFRFAVAFVAVFAMALIAYTLAGQSVIKNYNLEYVLWALLLGLLISNTIGLPKWLSYAARTELYIKTGLVLLGAEVLFNKLLALGIPGILISWVVTPIVLIATYVFGQYILKIPSKSLNMVISADMSVCGVSAAVATAAACKAKKEELSLAIGLSLIFTVIMIVVQPYIVLWSGMGEVIGGAWIGGTIDSTGAVAAAGTLVGGVAKDVAATVKMIQNILIGAVAFGVSLYWVSFVERNSDGERPKISEVWTRFPRFTLGFIGISLLLSAIQSPGLEGRMFVSSIVDGATKQLREWMFCLAFVSIGLESNFREYRHMLASGKPVVLYVCGQALNLILSFLMAWFVFTYLFPETAAELMSK
ncbi:MAG: YeiH family protein [Pirellula sp.]